MSNWTRPSSLRCKLVMLDKVYQMTDRLGVQIRQSGFQPDVVVAIARGGFVPARLLCDFLNIHHLGSIKVQHYRPGAQKEQKARIVYPLNADIHNKKVLLVDDVNDTGESFIAALQHLREKNPTMIHTAVLHEKKKTAFEADYVSEYLENWRWILYQWAMVEDIGKFLEKLAPNSLSEAHNGLKEYYDIKLSIPELQRILFFTNTNLTL